MSVRPVVESLPAEHKQWLDGALVAGNFSGYEALAAELKARGYEISKSAVHRYGQAFEERLKALRMVTEQARAVVEHSPDDEDAVSQALTRLVQERLFSVAMDMQVDPESIDLPKLTRAIADLSRASIAGKKFSAEVRGKVAAEASAAAVEGAQAEGLMPEQIGRAHV
jgi:hypothetical protein